MSTSVGTTEKDEIAEAKKRLTDIDPNCDPLTTAEMLQMLGKMESAQEVIKRAQKNVGEVATVAGLMVECNIVKQKLELCYEKLDRMTKLYGTLKLQFDQFQQQRIRELQLKVGAGGSTTPEDWDD